MEAYFTKYARQFSREKKKKKKEYARQNQKSEPSPWIQPDACNYFLLS